jgi:Pyridoxamine 5'-phosphate oxidase
MTDKQTPEWMGKNRKLTPAEVKEFLAEPVVARIATIDESGAPYVTPCRGSGRAVERTA